MFLEGLRYHIAYKIDSHEYWPMNWLFGPQVFVLIIILGIRKVII
jgi:hypothetical protein